MQEYFTGMEQIAEYMPGGFFIYRADGEEELLYVNDALLRIFGCGTLEEFKQLTGYTFRGLVHPDDLEAVEASIAAQIKGNSSRLDYVEYRIICKDGSVRWIDDYGHLVHTGENGDLFYVFVSDTTERHEREEELGRESKIIEGLSRNYGSIFFLDLDTELMRPYRLQSVRSRELFGGMGEMGGREFDWKKLYTEYARKYVLQEDRDRYLAEGTTERIRERFLSEEAYTVAYRCRSWRGGMRHMEMSVVRIEGRHHAVIGYRDVTEQALRIQRETAERLRMENELEREKKLNEAKSTFLFNVSHDIRTPMNAIVGFTELAKRNIDSPELLGENLDKVDVSNRHMMDLIDDLLEMSQVDSGQTQLRVEESSLTEQLDAAVELLRVRQRRSGSRSRRRFGCRRMRSMWIRTGFGGSLPILWGMRSNLRRTADA